MLVRGIAPPLPGHTVRAGEFHETGKELAVFRKRTTEMDPLALIRKWSMEGARGDLQGRFGSLVDINAIVAERSAEPRSDVSSPTQPPLLLKPAGEDDWQPLLVVVPDQA
jgi:hypothetical protein